MPGLETSFLNQSRPLSQYRPLLRQYRPLLRQYRPLLRQYRPLLRQYRPLLSQWGCTLTVSDLRCPEVMSLVRVCASFRL
ncbi:hypothetical protein BgiBS90_008858 [Biomphalaria glabrata]|nr:hypothetical protein BgiBS90_008858 [Biomphalaria glabrata]